MAGMSGKRIIGFSKSNYCYNTPISPKVPFFVNDFESILFINKHIDDVRCVWNIWNTTTFGNGTVTRKIIFMQSNYDTFPICKNIVGRILGQRFSGAP